MADPDPDKVKAIVQMTAPHTVKQVRQFLGATGFFRKHVQDYVTIAAPLSSLLKKQAKFHWAYFSRKLREGENKFPTIDVEALAVVEAVRTHELSFYDYKLIYKPGASHYVPDSLSRKISPIDEILDTQTVAAGQQEDPLWSEIRDYLQEHRILRRRIPLNLEEFEMRDNLLHYLRVLPGRVVSQLVIPCNLRTRALEAIHADAASAHPGIFRTYCCLRDHYYFPQMLAETKNM
ncbi:uncharacterized protein LOC125041998 [Penaeus chinensis]|uniref:uncharacterized protein LOC125041998 n=1 Tax=Penaeus chinensis TaxID=139456 RepID=UPI001FB68795|nr:uncharacterized protein LOC125041998 [Penaeus chinensis]